VPQSLSKHDIPSARTALDELGRQIEWVHSYVTRDRVYCFYRTPNEAFEPTTVERPHA
jgi:uncharacterized protein DUF4242